MLQDIIMGYEHGDRSVILSEKRIKGYTTEQCVKMGLKPYVVRHRCSGGKIDDIHCFNNILEAASMFNKYKDFINMTQGRKQ